MKCAAGVGGDGDRIGGEWVVEPLAERRHIAICRWERLGAAGFAPTFCRMSAGGDELFWHRVPDLWCQFGRGVFAVDGDGDGRGLS